MPKKPITVRGVSYESRAACAKAFNTTGDHVRRMEREGKLDMLGLGRHAFMMRIELADRCYRTVDDCATDLGLSKSTVYHAALNGRLHKLGTGTARDNDWFRGRPSAVSIPCQILKQDYGSIKEASRRTGIPYGKLHRIMRPHVYRSKEKANVEVFQPQEDVPGAVVAASD
ncbi:helix-turn-helix DNA binding domain protein [Rhodobacter phage RcKickapoo]|nr:helix-turn-helix DNA binding domain protein [Rhodobacter phage RcKickapoo]